MNIRLVTLTILLATGVALICWVTFISGGIMYPLFPIGLVGYSSKLPPARISKWRKMESENSGNHETRSVTGENVQLSGETTEWLFTGEPDPEIHPSAIRKAWDRLWRR